jgi:hypothetical protein
LAVFTLAVLKAAARGTLVAATAERVPGTPAACMVNLACRWLARRRRLWRRLPWPSGGQSLLWRRLLELLRFGNCRWSRSRCCRSRHWRGSDGTLRGRLSRGERSARMCLPKYERNQLLRLRWNVVSALLWQ